MVKEIFSYEIVADVRCNSPRFVVYLIGKWDYHVMDWAGCNYKRCKAPNQPLFIKLQDALDWVNNPENIPSYVDVAGSHVSDHDNVWEYKLIYDGWQFCFEYIWKDTEPTQNEWDELRENYREAKKNPERWSN